MAHLAQGDIAPAFERIDQRHNTVRLSDFLGHRVLVYFYPKADTPGCTQQACAIQEAAPELAGLNVEVLGLSPDSPESQNAFGGKYGLRFRLLADEDHAVADAYGVWGEKQKEGKTTMGIIRSAFLIDEEGRIMEARYKIGPQETVPFATARLASEKT